ncbi:beta-N-acetylhexosaminidase [Jatrophihabitans endophyticus]|uniref:beta-N-acetylhexosaminidase n=1 Tax=Jatrophihabitans endophyticus TaxID=1206085 RepID=A0A1M5G9B7_9ACTN|nr:glycoside hydrolase family 3 N-terminal domain-containing protein [Jatrophihabitans endophyticus]SHG00278.1 beta-N-acetylhexosaminidase [Jatrophihabitans endophyticus]
MRAAAVVLSAVAVVALAGCSGSDGDGAPNTTPATSAPTTAGATTTPPGTPTPAPTSTPASTPASTSTPATAAQRALARMSLRQRVGQLVMIDCPSTGVAPATRTALTRYDVGSVILDGTSRAGASATRGVTRELSSLAGDRVGLLVATDQEGGLVQRLQGEGFDRIPSGTVQGQRSATALRRDAARWGAQLRDAGVNVNLGPVLDVVPAGGGANPPIGDLDRQYGSTPRVVTSHGLAFAKGMADAGVDPVVKHFPGLGRVSGNTDVAAGVTDTVTEADDADLGPFRAAVAAGVPFVMMSTAIYRRIDPGTPAAFSTRIVTGLLRERFGFRGVVVSDDIGAADQVAAYPPGERAVRFVRAGGDIALSVVGSDAGPMTTALLAEARSDASFRKLVDAAVLRVLQAKQARGLVH